jgi:hypothetical protein
MRQVQHRFAFSLMTMIMVAYLTGCSTVTPPPERVAAAQTQAWGGGAQGWVRGVPPPPTADATNNDLAPLANLIIELVRLAVK